MNYDEGWLVDLAARLRIALEERGGLDERSLTTDVQHGTLPADENGRWVEVGNAVYALTKKAGPNVGIRLLRALDSVGVGLRRNPISARNSGLEGIRQSDFLGTLRR